MNGRVRTPPTSGTQRALHATMLHRFFLLAVVCVLSVACGDEAVRDIDASTTCDGPTWQWERDLDHTEWTDAGGEAAESGGTVLVVWQQRIESGGPDMGVQAVLLDAATGEELRTLVTPGGAFNTVWVRAVDGGFYVFAESRDFTVFVYFVAHGSPSFTYVETVPSNRSIDVLSTSAGVLLFVDSGVHLFDHDGAAVEVHTDAVQQNCDAATVLRDGRVMAWCFDEPSGVESFVTMNADGSAAVLQQSQRVADEGWSARLEAGDAGVFYLDAGDDGVSVGLLNDDGTQQIAPVPVVLQALEASSDAYVVGAGACDATCEGLRLVVEGNTAMLEVYSVHPDLIERILVNIDGDRLTFESLGTRDTATRASLTPAAPGALSMWTRFGWSIPVFDTWPPQTIVVERTCLRRPIDDGATDG